MQMIFKVYLEKPFMGPRKNIEGLLFINYLMICNKPFKISLPILA